MTFPTWMILGLCINFWPGDDEATMRSCELTFASKMREIDDPRIDLGFGLNERSFKNEDSNF